MLQQSQVNAMVNRFLVSAKLLAGAGGTAWWMRIKRAGCIIVAYGACLLLPMVYCS
jgi:hypothetical protein